MQQGRCHSFAAVMSSNEETGDGPYVGRIAALQRGSSVDTRKHVSRAVRAPTDGGLPVVREHTTSSPIANSFAQPRAGNIAFDTEPRFAFLDCPRLAPASSARAVGAKEPLNIAPHRYGRILCDDPHKIP